MATFLHGFNYSLDNDEMDDVRVLLDKPLKKEDKQFIEKCHYNYCNAGESISQVELNYLNQLIDKNKKFDYFVAKINKDLQDRENHWYKFTPKQNLIDRINTKTSKAENHYQAICMLIDTVTPLACIVTYIKNKALQG